MSTLDIVMPIAILFSYFHINIDQIHHYYYYYYSPGIHNQFELTPILSVGIFIVLTALICLAIATVAAIKLRTTQNQQQNKNHNNIQRPGNLPIKEKISLPLSQSEEMYDEKNPDVVPYNEGKSSRRFYLY